MSAERLVIPPRPHTISDTDNHPNLKDVYGFYTLTTTEITTITIKEGSDDAGSTATEAALNGLVIASGLFIRGDFTSIKLAEGTIQLWKDKRN